MSKASERGLGEFPGRPDHDDFWVLSDHHRALDAKADAGQVDVEAEVGQVADWQSAYYMAKARASKFLAEVGTSHPLATVMSAYLDGLLAGYALAAKRAHEGDNP